MLSKAESTPVRLGVLLKNMFIGMLIQEIM